MPRLSRFGLGGARLLYQSGLGWYEDHLSNDARIAPFVDLEEGMVFDDQSAGAHDRRFDRTLRRGERGCSASFQKTCNPYRVPMRKPVVPSSVQEADRIS